MSQLQFHGTGAGLGRIDRGGDRSDPSNYVLYCGCGTQLGPLGTFNPDREGKRCVACPKCMQATIVSREGQILEMKPVAAILEERRRAQKG